MSSIELINSTKERFKYRGPRWALFRYDRDTLSPGKGRRTIVNNKRAIAENTVVCIIVYICFILFYNIDNGHGQTKKQQVAYG